MAEPSTAEAIGAAYEELRSHMLKGSARHSHLDGVLILRDGLAAWMARRRQLVAVRPAARAAPVATVHETEPLHAGIVQVLANMALGARVTGEMRA